MSELKAFNSERIYWAVEQVERVVGDIDSLHLDDNLFYIKSEADKVIAEKDKEIAQLQAMLEERNKQVGELKEERRWRKFSEEKPKEEDEYYLVFDKYGYRDTDRWRKDKMGVWGFSVHGETVRYFMPLPSAPKEEK